MHLSKQHGRAAPRRRILKAGQILFGSSAVDCLVRDISHTGARITLKSPLWFPDSFVLSVPTDKIFRRAHIVWRRDGQIGINFED